MVYATAPGVTVHPTWHAKLAHMKVLNFVLEGVGLDGLTESPAKLVVLALVVLNGLTR